MRRTVLLALFAALPASGAAAQPGVKYTNSGYAACFTRDDHEKFTSYIVDGDREAAASLIADGSCIMLKAGVAVYIEDTAVFSGLVKIRPKGSRVTLWTNIEAVR